MRKLLASHAEVLIGGLLLGAALAAIGWTTVGTNSHGARYTPDTSFPHAGPCAHPDRVTGPPCRAARDLLLGANSGDAPLYCHGYAPRHAYQACVAGVAFSDPGFSAFQTVGFRVRSVTLVIDGEARVLVHVWPFDDPPSDAVIVMERQEGWWRVIDVAPPPATPAS